MAAGRTATQTAQARCLARRGTGSTSEHSGHFVFFVFFLFFFSDFESRNASYLWKPNLHGSALLELRGFEASQPGSGKLRGGEVGLPAGTRRARHGALEALGGGPHPRRITPERMRDEDGGEARARPLRRRRRSVQVSSPRSRAPRGGRGRISKGGRGRSSRLPPEVSGRGGRKSARLRKDPSIMKGLAARLS